LSHASCPRIREIPPDRRRLFREIALELESIISPEAQVTKEIYAEIPIEMEVIGTYFNLADFFDRISRLLRIVNVRDLQPLVTISAGVLVILNVKFDVVMSRLLPEQAAKPDDNKKIKGKKRKK
jgi:type IV pilus assembly protein PilO